jgi:hypothetical protein
MALPYENLLQLGTGFYVDPLHANARHWAKEKGGNYILGIWMLESEYDNLNVCPRPSNWWPATNDIVNHTLPGCDVETARYDPHPPPNEPTGSKPPYLNSEQWKFNAHTFNMLLPLPESNTP